MPTSERQQRTPRMSDWFSGIHLSVWLIFGAIFYVSDALDRIFGLSILIIPLVALPGLIAITTTLGGLVKNIGARSRKRMVSVIGAPVVTVGLLAASVHYQINVDWIRFHLMQPYYVKLVRALPGPSPRYHEWPWGETGGVAVANIFYSLVYDETDKPLDRPIKRGQEGAALSSRSYGNHFFLITTLFQ